MDTLRSHYNTVIEAAQQSKIIFANNVASVETVPMTEAAIQVAELGLILIKVAESGEGLSGQEAESYQKIIDSHAVIFDESIIAIVKPTEQLLQQLIKANKA